MLIKIISDNFKDLLDTLKTKPSAIIMLALMFLVGFFINKWVSSKDSTITDIKASNKELNMIRDSMYNYRYQALYYKTMYEQSIKKNDSLFRKVNEEVLRPIIQSNK